jgi:hypothetical protein
MRTSHTSRFPFKGSFHDAERVYIHFVFLSPADLIFPRFHGGVKRLKFRSQPNITNITLGVIYSCRGVFLTVSQKLRTILSVFTLKEIIQHILQSFLMQNSNGDGDLVLDFASTSGGTSGYSNSAAAAPFIDPSLESFHPELTLHFNGRKTKSTQSSKRKRDEEDPEGTLATLKQRYEVDNERHLVREAREMAQDERAIEKQEVLRRTEIRAQERCHECVECSDYVECSEVAMATDSRSNSSSLLDSL